MEKLKDFLENLRVEYVSSPLNADDMPVDPFSLFATWFEEARKSEVGNLNAMTLSTSNGQGRVSSRVVLLKDATEDGFTFYTNYDSRKAKDMAANPNAALAFYWPELGRQVNISGRVEKVSSEESDEYWYKRPRDSQLSGAASPQSDVVSSREELEELVAQLDADYKDSPIPRPSNWGGYILEPNIVGFWQARPNRLHDRVQYALEGSEWVKGRIGP
jgi:pyridoxamine-phosphate oxidase